MCMTPRQTGELHQEQLLRIYLFGIFMFCFILAHSGQSTTFIFAIFRCLEAEGPSAGFPDPPGLQCWLKVSEKPSGPQQQHDPGDCIATSPPHPCLLKLQCFPGLQPTSLGGTEVESKQYSFINVIFLKSNN